MTLKVNLGFHYFTAEAHSSGSGL